MTEHRIRLTDDERQVLVKLLDTARKNHLDLSERGKINDLWYRLKKVGGSRRDKRVWQS